MKEWNTIVKLLVSVVKRFLQKCILSNCNAWGCCAGYCRQPGLGHVATLFRGFRANQFQPVGSQRWAQRRPDSVLGERRRDVGRRRKPSQRDQRRRSNWVDDESRGHQPLFLLRVFEQLFWEVDQVAWGRQSRRGRRSPWVHISDTTASCFHFP